MNQLIKVVWVPCDPQRPAELKEIGQGDLRAYQALVGGPIELVPLSNPGLCDPDAPDLCRCGGALFNEEGLGRLPANTRASAYLASLGLDNGGHGYYGDAVFIGMPPGEEFGPATPDMIDYWVPGDGGPTPDGEHGPAPHGVITYEVPGGTGPGTPGQAGR